MSKIDFSIVTTWEKDKPLQELNRLLDVRARDIGDASTRDLLYATAHTILRSLKPLVKQAKVSKGELRKSYTLVPTGLVMGWAPSAGGKRKMHPHHPFKGDYDPAIRPICLWGGGIPRHRVYVYRATPKYGGKRRTWSKNLHKGHWYIAAFDEGVARKYVEDTLMKRWIAKFSGLARSAILAIRKALAVQSNDPAPVDDVRFFSEDNKVQKPFLQLFRNLLRIPTGNVVTEVRVRLFECMDLAGEKTDLVGFCQAEIKITTRDIIQ